MSQLTAIWVLIVLAFIFANLPFLLQRPLLFLPWPQMAKEPLPARQRWALFIVFSAVLGGLTVGVFHWLSQQFFTSSWMLLLTTVGLLAGGAVLFSIPGWVNGKREIKKSLFDRFIELTVLFILVGLLGIAFEASMGNVFPQQWEFYVITYSLFLVFGYPGFVLRYLLKRRRVLVDTKTV